MTIKVALDTKVLDGLPKAVRGKASRAVQAARGQLAAEMRGRCPVREGELRDSIEEFEAGPTLGVVWVDAEHGMHVEYGTSFMAAEPFIRDSVRAVRARFERDAGRVFS